MAGYKFPGNWFYHVRKENIFQKDDTDTPMITAMVKACQSDNDAEFIFQTLDEAVNHIVHDQVSLNCVNQFVEIMYNTRIEIDKTMKSYKEEINKLKKKLDRQQYLYDACTKQMRDLMAGTENEQLQLSDGTDIKLRLNPGKLKTEYVPSIDDYKRYGDNFIRATYAWDLNKIKSALVEGEIDHNWVAKHGFEYIRDVSLTIKSLTNT
jgi:hypothetical protein